jgi:hypothetical protein
MSKFLGEIPDGPFAEAEVEHLEHLLRCSIWAAAG